MTANENMERKRKRAGSLPDIESQLMNWFSKMRNLKAEISGPLLIQKAQSLAREHQEKTGEYLDLEFSTGWLAGFKSKHNLAFKKLHGEKADADVTGADSWLRNVLPGILSRYS